jgi:hypothetical protein
MSTATQMFTQVAFSTALGADPENPVAGVEGIYGSLHGKDHTTKFDVSTNANDYQGLHVVGTPKFTQNSQSKQNKAVLELTDGNVAVELTATAPIGDTGYKSLVSLVVKENGATTYEKKDQPTIKPGYVLFK